VVRKGDDDHTRFILQSNRYGKRKAGPLFESRHSNIEKACVQFGIPIGACERLSSAANKDQWRQDLVTRLPFAVESWLRHQRQLEETRALAAAAEELDDETELATADPASTVP